MDFTIAVADLEKPAHADGLVEIIDAYAREPGGQREPLSPYARANLVEGLAEHPSALVLLACIGEQPVGTAVCIWSYSTFAGKPSLNIHDLAVLPSHRGRGVGRGLLAEIERRARERGCAKITLEVHDTNDGGSALFA